MKTISWPAVWAEIEEAFGTPYAERTERQKMLSCNGLCFAVSAATGDHRNKLKILFLGHSMGLGMYWCSHDDINSDLARSDFALLMAALGQKGFEDLLRYAEGYDG